MKTGTYSHPNEVGGWLGWVMPDDEAWITYVATDGKAFTFAKCGHPNHTYSTPSPDQPPHKDRCTGDSRQTQESE